VYSTFVILIGAGALIEPLHLLVMYVIAELAFVIGLPYFQEDPFVRNSIIVNSLIFVIFTFFFARQVYVEAYRSSQKDQTIKRQNEQLQKQYDEILVSSQTDCMTGLYNRFSLDDMIQDMWEDALDKNQSFTVFMCDIDDFKVLNDTHGHIKGDECITKVGKIIRNTIERHKGLAFRYGGDEFLLAIKGIDTKIADKIKEELREKVKNIELIHDGKRLHVSVSVGKVSRNPHNYDGPWDVIYIADKEMYKSKARKPKQSKNKHLFREISKKWKNLSCYTR
jgi:diguanylate cyclase (GGDEF)-like protein